MIFFATSQLYSFCLILMCGIFFGLFYGVFEIILVKKHQNNIIDFIFKFIFSLIFSIFLIYSINIFYFGDFNLIIISAFILGFVWCKKSTQNLLDFFEIKFYYIYIKTYFGLRFYFEGKHESIKD